MDRTMAKRLREDIGLFAEVLIGEPLWPHQLEVARNDARIRSMLTGRQSGKSRTCAVSAVHGAFTRPGFRVLIISAGEEAAKRLLAECAALALGSDLLKGSVLDDTKQQITLSNGSWIRSVPASEKQIRGETVDLLIIDEACFVDDAIWNAARYTVISRPESRVLMASTPWGRRDRFFGLAWQAGERHEEGYASFRWPSTVSPLVDSTLLDMWRTTSTDRQYRSEVEAEWQDDAGAYFTSAELEGAVDDVPLLRPEDADGARATGGIDWAFEYDASALTVITTTGEGPLTEHRVSWIEEAFHTPYAAFIRRIVDIAQGYRFRKLHSELNGVGAMPTQQLALALGSIIVGVHTDSRLKEDGFGRMKMLIQEGRFRLPRHPALLQQLAALEFEERDSGTTRIAVPERAGHDDLAMSCMLATALLPAQRRPARRQSFADLRIGGDSPLRASDGTAMDLVPGSPQWESWRRLSGGREI